MRVTQPTTVLTAIGPVLRELERHPAVRMTLTDDAAVELFEPIARVREALEALIDALDETDMDS